jgi:NAD-dependent deacetylase
MYDAVQEAQTADIFIIIGTSLNVYPAAGLVQYVRPGTPIYLIDPKPVASKANVEHLECGASEGMRLLRERLAKEYKV